MKRWAVSILLLLLLGLAALPASAQSDSAWTGEYFANPNLSGAPVFTLRSEATPSHDWGAGSPGAGLSPDFFSARWTSTQSLNGGNYGLNVRADDGVRVYINGIPYINEWHPSPGNTYEARFTLAAGQYTFVVEFYEGGGNAFLQYNFLQEMPPPLPTNVTATVITNLLNVRNAPFNGAIIGQIGLGQTYQAIGRTSYNEWVQIIFNNAPSWVNARYVSVSNMLALPVVASGIRPTPGTFCNGLVSRLGIGSQGRVLPGLPNNLRAFPSTGSTWVGTIPAGGVFTVLTGPQCSEGILWWEVNYNGLFGWTGEGQGATYWVEPATGSLGATATVTAYFLNVRNAPGIWGVILTRISRGQTYTVVGRNSNNSWLQLNVNGVIGWVNARYVSASNLGSVPVIG